MVNKGASFADFVRSCPHTYARTQQFLPPLWAAMIIKLGHTSMLTIPVSFVKIRMLKKIEKVLNKEYLSLCGWFIDNKLSIPFGDDKKRFFSLESKAHQN